MFILYKKAEGENVRRDGCEAGSISWPMKEVNVILAYLSSIYTFFSFAGSICLIPWMLLSYTCTHFWRSGWTRWLSKKYPNMEFIVRTTARSVVDTPRNQCIISLLLTVQGNSQVQLIKNRVKEEILERRRGDKLVFPHLKTILTSKWGNYAWEKGSEKKFKLENHVLLAPPTFKGRPITDQNIQEVTSDLIAKFLPPEVPPWQILVIPATPDKSYLLIRLHHLYLSEEGLTLGDLLLLRKCNWESSPVLDGVFRPPVVIPRVYAAVSESTSNMWNEIVSQYDPVEKPDVVKHPSLKSCFFLACIVVYTSIKSYFSEDKHSLTAVFETEMQKRCLTFALVTESFFNTLSFGLIVDLFVMSFRIPFEMFKLPFRLINLVLDTPKWPLTIAEESVPKMVSLSQDEVYLYWLYLGHYVVQEVVYLFKKIYKAPRVLFEELFLPELPSNVHKLQTMSFCGRKVVSWSESVPKDLLKQICYETGATEREVLLSALAGSLRCFFSESGFSLPDNVMTTCNFTPKGHLPVTGHMGFLCLPLPLHPANPKECLEATKQSLYTAKEAQTILYLATEKGIDTSLLIGMCPTLFAKAALYLLSRRYAITVSLVEGTSNCTLLWGQPVDGLMYWSPPQANVCLSITIMNYGDSVTLGVMADAQLTPHHSDIPVHFPRYIKNLATSLGIPCPSSSQG